jgi:DNA polymerase elongation subunit (family B)
MRNDAIGLFWEDAPHVIRKDKKKAVQKVVPPNPVWLSPDYLPNLKQAQEFKVPLMTDEDLVNACINKERLLFDIETYQNYFLASFRSAETGKVVYFEMTDEMPLDIEKLKWIMENFTTVGFNSLSYDLTVTAIALQGYNNLQLKNASDMLIRDQMRPVEVLRKYKTKLGKYDHIDLIEVAPLFASLKIYGARVHTPRLEDLPFEPDTILTPQQMDIVRWYNIEADLVSTGFLHHTLQEHLELRYSMSNEEGVDLRSKSDAQIAEAVFAAEYLRATGSKAQRVEIPVGTEYRYFTPHFIQFQTPLMQRALKIIQNTTFVVGEDGSIQLPPSVKNLMLEINKSVYRLGIGGLHSTEKQQAVVEDEEYILRDKDVTSFYPFIILNQGLYPKHLGPIFLQIYREIVMRRVAAKARGDKVIADSLKIVINGSYGKFGSKYSVLYSPDLIIQTTLTGQLSLLMLIERLELAGIQVVSANTDGIVIHCKRTMQEQMDAIVKQWELDVAFQTEETIYKGLYSRDVNNYIAVKEDCSVKTKGAYANPWNDSKNPAMRLHKNPVTTVCIDAVCDFLTTGKPIAEHIHGCRDIRKFVVVRSVTGGAVKVWDETNTEFLGKSIRWYYANDVEGNLVYAASGKKVPRSDGAMPCLTLPTEFPANVDYDWYIKESYKILLDIGAINENPC